jgi:hypothetical protein
VDRYVDEHYSCILYWVLTLWVTLIQDMRSGGASVEETLDLWASGLRSAKERIASLFTQKRVAASACPFLDVLIGNEPRKTGWMRAEAAGDPGPWWQQALPGRGRWDADALRDVIRKHVVEHLGTEDGVLVIDETGFLKKGQASCGVGRHYTGSVGKITNYQIGIFATYVSARGHALVDRALPPSFTSSDGPSFDEHIRPALSALTHDTKYNCRARSPCWFLSCWGKYRAWGWRMGCTARAC